MKTIIVSFSLTALLMGPAMADDSRKADKNLNKLLKCARNIVEKNRGGESGLEAAAAIIDKASSIKEDADALKAEYKACKKFKRKNRSNKKNADRNKIAEQIQNLDASDFAKSIIKPFNRPTYRCKFRTIEAHVAVGLGLGVGVGAAKCEGNNGRRYILLAPQASFNLGFMVTALSRSQEMYDENRLVSAGTDDGYLAAGLFIMGLFDGGAELDQIGSGVGFGGSLGLTGQLKFKAIPLPNKFDSIKEQL